MSIKTFPFGVPFFSYTKVFLCFHFTRLFSTLLHIPSHGVRCNFNFHVLFEWAGKILSKTRAWTFNYEKVNKIRGKGKRACFGEASFGEYRGAKYFLNIKILFENKNGLKRIWNLLAELRITSNLLKLKKKMWVLRRKFLFKIKRRKHRKRDRDC